MKIFLNQKLSSSILIQIRGGKEIVVSTENGCVTTYDTKSGTYTEDG